jgi:hypothetical protein
VKRQVRQRVPDHELLYVGAMCHDLGLTEKYRSTDQRFELDGADAETGTTFGTVNDDVLACFDPTFQRQDFVRMIKANPLPD